MCLKFKYIHWTDGTYVLSIQIQIQFNLSVSILKSFDCINQLHKYVNNFTILFLGISQPNIIMNNLSYTGFSFCQRVKDFLKCRAILYIKQEKWRNFHIFPSSCDKFGHKLNDSNIKRHKARNASKQNVNGQHLLFFRGYCEKIHTSFIMPKLLLPGQKSCGNSFSTTISITVKK